MRNDANAEPTAGRCGMHCPGMFPTSPSVVCALPAGHVGWHRSDEGTEWGISESGWQGTANECVCWQGSSSEHFPSCAKSTFAAGVAAGRRQAAGLVDYVRIQHHTLGLHDHMGADLSCHGCGLLSATEAAPAEPVEEDGRG